MRKLGKRQKVNYLKEIEELSNEHARLLTHHTQNVLKRFGEEMFKLNMKYFDMRLEE
jgi:hypothetical protein